VVGSKCTLLVKECNILYLILRKIGKISQQKWVIVLHKNIYKMLFIILLCSLNSIGSNSISTLGECFKELHKRLSMQATSEIAAMDVDSADKVFHTLLKNNSPVVKLFRVNSNGIIINESTQKSSNHVMRNISNQQWFAQVQRDTQPYYGITRDSTGSAFLFWVWPLKNMAGQFAGVLAAKIDPSEVINFVNDLKPASLRLEVNGKTVLTSDWNNPQNIESVSWNISDSLVISCYYKSTRVETASQTKPMVSNPAIIASESSLVLPDNSEIFSEEKTEKAEKKPVLNSFLLIIIISGFAIMIFFKIGKRWMPSNQREAVFSDNPERSTSIQGGVEEIMDLVDDSSLPSEKSHLQALSEKRSSQVPENRNMPEESQENGTVAPKASYNLKEDEVFRKTQDQSDSEMSRIRNELYREIHGQIIHWVVCESARLSNCLEELSGRISRIEGSEGSAEIELIREDALRISKEIEIFKDSFSDSKKE